MTAVDCDDDENKGLCGQYGVKGFPTIKVITPKTNKNGGRSIAASDYNGERTLKAIADHVTSFMISNVKKITSPELMNDFLGVQNATSKVLLFTKKGATSALYKALSTQFEEVKFAQIRDNQVDTVETFGIKEFPTIVFLPGGDGDSKVYQGKMVLPDIATFIRLQLPEVDNKVADETVSSDDTTEQKSTASAGPPRSLGFEKLESVQAFQEKCLSPTSKSALLAESGRFTELKFSSKREEFNYFEYSSEVKIYLETLGVQSPGIFFLNGKKKWFLSPKHELDSQQSVLDFLDSVKQGDAGAKTFIKPNEPKDEL